MKGVKKGNEDRVLKRRAWIADRFRRDCRERMARGYVDPPLSPGKCNDEFRVKFHTSLNSQRMYQLRAEIFKEFGLDKKGRPENPGTLTLPGIPKLAPAAIPALNREVGDPLFHVALIKTVDETYGAFLQDALGQLQQKGMVPDTLKVDAVTPRYVSVSSFPEEAAVEAPPAATA